MNMRMRYRLFLHRKSVYYAFDDINKTFTSLKTKDRAEANRLLMAMNESGQATRHEFKSGIYAFLRKIHNFAVDMNWLPATVIPRRQWPAIHYKEKHAITLEEHQKIISAEVNSERKAL